MVPKYHWLAVLAAITLLAAPVFSQDKNTSTSNLSNPQIAGKQLFVGKECTACHTLAEKDEGEKTAMQSTRDDEWFAGHVAEHSEVILRDDRSSRRKRRTAAEEVDMLRAYLYGTTAAEKKQIDSMSEDVFKGAYLYAQNKCQNCHMIAGEGKDIGPDLSRIASKHDRAWLLKNLLDPKQFAPDTEMPSYEELGEQALNQIAAYLTTLK